MNNVTFPTLGGGADPHMRMTGRTMVSAEHTEPGSARAPASQWHRDGIDIAVFDASAVPPRKAGGYAVLYANVFRTAHANLNALDMAEVLADGNGLALASRDCEVVAGLYYSRTAIDGYLDLMIMGLVSSGTVPGLSSPLVSAATVAEIGRARLPVSARAIVRVMPEGTVNAASAKALTKAGFFPIGLSSNAVTARHTHLHLSADERDGRFLSLEMAAKQADLLAASQRTLAGWAREGGGND